MYPAKEYLSKLEELASQICNSCIGNPIDDERWYELQNMMNLTNEIEGAFIAKKDSSYLIDFFFIGKSTNRRHSLKSDLFEIVDRVEAEVHGGWTLGHFEALEKISSLDDALRLAYQVLDSLKKQRLPEELPVSLVSGPISTGGLGNRTGNLRIFAKTIWKLNEVGILVFDQMPFELIFHKMLDDKIITGNQLLEEFYAPFLRSGQIHDMFAINSWETSNGANFEHRIGKEVGLPYFVLPLDFHLMEEKLAIKSVAQLLRA